uniref:7-deoxyloganetin glucosyltransferase n=1 Tax=Vitis vinifera TaxID=29760 RepID=F6HTK4_VITVI
MAKLLNNIGFFITFVNTEHSHKRLLRSRGPNSLDGFPDFRFESIPDGLPPSDADVTQRTASVCESTSKNSLAPFCSLISKLNDPSSSCSPVSCIVSDGVMSFTLDAAEKFGVPEVVFWTTSACGFLGYRQYRDLLQRGLIPLKDESCLTNGYLDTIVDSTPGIMKTIRLRDFPAIFRTTDPNDIMLNFIMVEAERASKASAIILNTFDALEKDVLDALRANLPPVYTIGPLQHLVHQISDDGLTNLGSSLWKEQPECLQWLDSKEPNSVVYVNFGSMIVMTPQHLTELAWGLANSNKPFLWIIRPDLVAGDSAPLPPEFITETRDRGMLASWFPQEQVLKHPAVGGFVTHCGWNSTSESICGGRDKVEKLVRELMDGEKGKKMKKKAMEWKKLAEEAIMLGGSSYNNFNKLLSDVLLSKK